MASISTRSRAGSLVLIIMLVCSGLLIAYPLSPGLLNVSGKALWIESSERDFNNGTFHNISVYGQNDNANLQINLEGIQTWTKKSPQTNPVAGTYHSTASVWGDDKILCYGGYWAYGQYLYQNETWIYDQSMNQWTRKYPAITPSARYYHGLATIYGTDKILLFGGYYYGALNDTWIYDVGDNTWTEIYPPTSPQGRYYHGMASIDNTKFVLLYGGYPYLTDTWIFDYKSMNWQQKFPQASPGGRYYHSLSTIYGTNKVLLFGGWYYTYDETWVYDLATNNWVQRYPNNRPAYRWFHSMAPVWGTDNVVLYGGYGYYWYYTTLNDTWIYDYSENTWTHQFTDPSPGATYYQSISTVWGTDRLILFGGYSPTYGYWADTWEYRHVLPVKNGTYVSKPYDTGARSIFSEIDWFANIPDNTSLRFQLRSGLNIDTLEAKDFVGPDGDKKSYYVQGAEATWEGHNGDQFIQYKVYFNMDVFTNSPRLKDVSITYNCMPDSQLMGPSDEVLMSNNKPIFTWYFTDYDSEYQKSFQVLIADDINFTYIQYDSGEQKSASQRWEFPSGTSYTDLPDGNWYWKVRSKDEDGCWTEYTDPWMFTIDTTAPRSAPIQPAHDGVYKNLDTITGVAFDADPGSGVEKTDIAIKRLSDNKYWIGTDWIPLVTWLEVKGNFNWYFDSREITWTSGDRYQIFSRSSDHATNTESPGSGNIFSIDRDGPVSNIKYPPDNVWLNRLDTITGDCGDISGSGTDTVVISIKCIMDSNVWDGIHENERYWNGTGWDTNIYWLPADGIKDWAYNSTTVPWTTGNHYNIRSRGIDRSNNYEEPNNGRVFLFDNHRPESLAIYINNDDKYTGDTKASLSLMAEDYGSGVALMSFSSDGIVWSNWEPFNSTKSYTLLAGEGEKFVYYRVRDYAGNIAEPVIGTIYLDKSPPVLQSLKINKGAEYTNSKHVTISIKAIDALSGINKVSYSFDSMIWLNWETYRNQKALDLPVGDGEKTVFIKLSDNVGNIGEPAYTTIVLDTVPPDSLWILINDGAEKTNSTIVSLKLNALDKASGISHASLSLDGELWGPWENFTLVRTFYLTSIEGEQTVYFRVKDHANNIAEPVHDTIVFSTPKDSDDDVKTFKDVTSGWDFWLIILIIIIIILILTIVGLIFKQRKRSREDSLAGALTIKPGTQIGPGITVEQLAAAIRLAQQDIQLPSVGGDAVPMAAPTPVPALAKSTRLNQPAQVAVGAGAVSAVGVAAGAGAGATELPALPPAKPEDIAKAQAQEESAIPQPSVVPPPPQPQTPPIATTASIPVATTTTIPSTPGTQTAPTVAQPGQTEAQTATPSQPSIHPEPTAVMTEKQQTTTTGPAVHLPDSPAAKVTPSPGQPQPTVQSPAPTQPQQSPPPQVQKPPGPTVVNTPQQPTQPTQSTEPTKPTTPDPKKETES
jgi:hypothetical protein